MSSPMYALFYFKLCIYKFSGTKFIRSICFGNFQIRYSKRSNSHDLILMIMTMPIWRKCRWLRWWWWRRRRRRRWSRQWIESLRETYLKRAWNHDWNYLCKCGAYWYFHITFGYMWCVRVFIQLVLINDAVNVTPFVLGPTQKHVCQILNFFICCQTHAMGDRYLHTVDFAVCCTSSILGKIRNRSRSALTARRYTKYTYSYIMSIWKQKYYGRIVAWWFVDDEFHLLLQKTSIHFFYFCFEFALQQ